MDNCTIDCIQIVGNFSFDQTCKFVQQECIQDSVQFIQGYYCNLHQSFVLLFVISVVLFTLLYLALNALTEHSLTPCVENVIHRFKISPTLAGVTFLAFANGAPDVLTAVLAGSSTSDSTVLIPFGSIFGASLFSTAFILSAVIFQSPGQSLKVKVQQILLPLSFYIFGIIYLIIVSLTYQKMNIYLASVLVIAYCVFIGMILKNQKKRRIQHLRQLQINQSQPQISISASAIPSGSEVNIKQGHVTLTEQITIVNQKIEKEEEEKPQQQNIVFVGIGKIQQLFQLFFSWCIPPRSNTQWEPLKAITSLVISPFILALSQDIQQTFQDSILGVPIFVYLTIPALLLIIHSAICCFKGWKPIQLAFYTIYAFLVTVAWITLVCGVLINLLELVQLLTNINAVFLGMTFLAWANCIGDYLSITTFAKKGRGSTAVSGIFSGQLFNFLIGFGASLVAQSDEGEYSFDIFSFKGDAFQIISDSIVVLVILSGLIYFSLVFYKVFKSKGLFQRQDAILFRSYYVVVLVLALLIAILTDFFRQISCDL